MGLAERLFDGGKAEAEVECLLDLAGVPYDHIGWDSYDHSLEIHEVPPDYRLSKDALKAIFDAGFLKIYVNHEDKWETHYPGAWRVSYPHKRRVDTKGIWVEEVPSSWPKEWIETGYVIVKPTTPVTSPARSHGTNVQAEEELNP